MTGKKDKSEFSDSDIKNISGIFSRLIADAIKLGLGGKRRVSSEETKFLINIGHELSTDEISVFAASLNEEVWEKAEIISRAGMDAAMGFLGMVLAVGYSDGVFESHIANRLNDIYQKNTFGDDADTIDSLEELAEQLGVELDTEYDTDDEEYDEDEYLDEDDEDEDLDEDDDEDDGVMSSDEYPRVFVGIETLPLLPEPDETEKTFSLDMRIEIPEINLTAVSDSDEETLRIYSRDEMEGDITQACELSFDENGEISADISDRAGAGTDKVIELFMSAYYRIKQFLDDGGLPEGICDLGDIDYETE